jgi:hypothetical protein
MRFDVDNPGTALANEANMGCGVILDIVECRRLVDGRCRSARMTATSRMSQLSRATGIEFHKYNFRLLLDDG